MAKKTATPEVSENGTIGELIALVGQLAQQAVNQQGQINALMDRLEDGGSGDGKAKADLVRHKYDTPPEKMSEMTVTPRRMVLSMVLLTAKRRYIEKLKNGEKCHLWQLIIEEFDKRMRSVDGKWADDAMIMSQLEKKEEDMRTLDEGLGAG